MQPLIQKFQAAGAEEIAVWIGCLLLVALGAQVFLMLVGSLNRLRWEHRQHRLSERRLETLVRAANLRLQEAEQKRFSWNGYRKFTVARKVCECEGVCSFYLEPHDRKPLPAFRPGQYLTFKLQVPGQEKEAIRCYSLSDSPPREGANKKAYYRVTIKKALKDDGSPGVASHFFCDRVKEGDILDIKEPSGKFVLDLDRETPVVLIAGGVGVTPMICMMNAIIESGSNRDIWFFFGVRNRSEHIFKEYLEQAAAKYDQVHLHVCYSKPKAGDRPNQDYQHESRVTVALMKELLPSSNYEYFMCGPPTFMDTITSDLEAWGVPKKNIFFEAFGPATVKQKAPVAPAASAPGSSNVIEVNFSRSGKLLKWSPDCGTLLDLAEANGISIESGCRAGNCGTCLVAMKSGDVEYLSGHGAPGEDRSCLTCICKPKSTLVLDA